MDKEALRKSMLEKRRELSPEELAVRSARVQQNLLADAVFGRARVVAIYEAFGAEVATRAIQAEAFKGDKRLAYPEVLKDGTMRFVVAAPFTAWSRSAFGFMVPVSTDTVALNDVDLFVVPGLAFDRAGRRLGRGAGHYDRTLASAPGLRVGLALGFQLLDELPEDPWDIRLDAIVTESEFIRASPRAAR